MIIKKKSDLRSIDWRSRDDISALWLSAGTKTKDGVTNGTFPSSLSYSFTFTFTVISVPEVNHSQVSSTERPFWSGQSDAEEEEEVYGVDVVSCYHHAGPPPVLLLSSSVSLGSGGRYAPQQAGSE